MKNSNTFYQEGDKECLQDAWNRSRAATHRHPFQQDRDRIIFTPSFRRLQSKTQVFQAGEYDFYRTRLTHSLEVGNIAKSICLHLLSKEDFLHPDFHLDLDLVEAISLAHDMGHPPFGHAGEGILHAIMEEYGGFEGNAQSLRILTRIIYDQKEGRFGMAPTRALLDGILKYKRPFSQRGEDCRHFLYDEQVEFLPFCFGINDLPAHLPPGMAANDFKSIECQIMDFADDVAYSSFDIVDSIKAKFITTQELEECIETRSIRGEMALDTEDVTLLKRLLKRIRDGFYDASLNKNIGRMIGSCSLKETQNFMSHQTNRYCFSLVVEPSIQREIAVLKKLCRTYVFQSPLLHQKEYKAGNILRGIAQALRDNYLERSKRPLVLVPERLHHVLLTTQEQASKARLLCDYLSGMTDGYAIRQYKRLYHPDYGSISELL